jgi:hypothetical protein
MPLITRQSKGSKLSIAELDGNLQYLEELAQQGGGGSSGPQGQTGPQGPEGGGSVFPFTGTASIIGTVLIDNQLTLIITFKL